MAWIFVVLGVLVTGGGLWLLARGPSATEAAAEMDVTVPRAKAVGETPWDVLMNPVAEEGPADRKRAARPFRMGLLIGTGFGVILIGMLWALLPTPTPSKEALMSMAKEKYHLLVVEQPTTTPSTAANGGTTTKPPTTTPTPAVTGLKVTVIIDMGDSVGVISKKLKDQGIIKDTASFEARLTEMKLDTVLQPGTFTLTKDMSNDDVIHALTGR